MEGQAHHLGGIEDAGAEQVFVDAGEGVVALAQAQDLVGHHGPVGAGIVGDLAHGFGQGALHDANAGALIALAGSGQAIEALGQLKQGATPASNDAFLHGGAGRIEGILDAQLAVLQLGFGGGAHLDHGHTPGQLGDPLIELLAVVFGIGVVKFAPDRGHPVGNGGLVVPVGHDRGAVLGDGDAARLAEFGQPGLVQGHGLVFADHGGASQDGDVTEHGLAAITEARGPHGGHLEHTAVFVHHQGGQGFAFHLLGQDQQGPPALGNGLEHGN